MSHSFSQCYIHSVFSTKGRFPTVSEKIKLDLYPYIGGIIKNLDGIPIMINGTNDHIHILSTISSCRSVSEMMRIVKTNASRWINELPDMRHSFEWQAGYGVFSVSRFEVDDLVRYIMGQEEHHRHRSFKEEYLELLRIHGLEYEEKYLWD